MIMDISILGECLASEAYRAASHEEAVLNGEGSLVHRFSAKHISSDVQWRRVARWSRDTLETLVVVRGKDMCLFFFIPMSQRHVWGQNLLIFGAMREFVLGGEGVWQVHTYMMIAMSALLKTNSPSYARLSTISYILSFPSSVLTDSLYLSVRDVSDVLVFSGSSCCHRFLIP